MQGNDLKNGCTYGKVARERVDNFIKLFKDFESNEFAHLEKSVEKLGKRPSWISTAVIIILTNITTALTIAWIIGR